jgi:hypothetical protein
MEKGNPISMRLSIKEFYFMLPMTGACNGFATFLAHAFWRKLKEPPKQERPLQSILKKSHQGVTYCGIVCYYELDGKAYYGKAPAILSVQMLRPVQDPPAHVGFVMNGLEIPVEERFLIMRTLCRMNLSVEFFDFSFTA